MFLTATDMINAKLIAEGALNESDILKYIINHDINSAQKKNMQLGERYYNGEHDILQKDFTSSRILENDETTGEQHYKLFRNVNRSNHKNINAFLKILVDQKTAYLVSKEPTIRVAGAENNAEKKAYEKVLCDFSDDTFNEMLQDLVTGASNKGFETIHIYYDSYGKLQYCIVPANEVIAIYDTNNQKELQEVIRYYDIVVVENGQEYTHKKVEWWTKHNVTYYIEKEKNLYMRDSNVKINPSPHWWSVTNLDGFDKKRQAHSWGRVPFLILKNNRNSTTDLEHIKGLIDAYDLISSEGTNNFLDLVELYWVIAGYGGETAHAIAKRLQINKAVHISDASGKVEAKQIELPIAGRLEYLKMLRKDIFHFGMGIDTDSDKFGNAPSGVSLKFQYTLLDQKAGNMISKLKKVIKELLWFVTDDYNRIHETNYNAEDIIVDINKNIITNDVEIVSMIQSSKGIVSDKTLLAMHPFVTDVNAEMQEMEAEEKRTLEKFGTDMMSNVE